MYNKIFGDISKRELVEKIIFTLIGGLILGFGVAFNAANSWGNDPISVFYDGLSKAINIDLGLASNITNYTLFAVVFLLGRKYINLGSFIYTLPLGFFISLGSKFYEFLNIPRDLLGHSFTAVIACVMLFFGVSSFIVANIGLDPWTGLAMILKDKTGKQYKVFKVTIDVVVLTLGFILGGKVGITTVVAAFLGGPIIQMMVNFLKNNIFKHWKNI